MGFISREYQGRSDDPIMAGLCRCFADDHLHWIDLPYRFSSWALDEPKNARLWFDEAGALRGWCALQSPFWSVDFGCDPALTAGLLPEMLEWAVARARAVENTPYARPMWFANPFTDRPEAVRALEGAGFVDQSAVGEDSWSKVWMERTAALPVRDFRVPPGFTVRALRGESEAEDYAEMHRAVFESKNMTGEWRRRAIRHPGYRPNLDVVVETVGGGPGEAGLAAFCVGWLDEAAGAGQIEPLGCRAEYRHLALGRLALAETIRRLQSAGARRIFVETDNYRSTALGLYEAMGFTVIRDVLVMRWDAAGRSPTET